MLSACTSWGLCIGTLLSHLLCSFATYHHGLLLINSRCLPNTTNIYKCWKNSWTGAWGELGCRVAMSQTWLSIHTSICLFCITFLTTYFLAYLYVLCKIFCVSLDFFVNCLSKTVDISSFPVNSWMNKWIQGNSSSCNRCKVSRNRNLGRMEVRQMMLKIGENFNFY